MPVAVCFGRGPRPWQPNLRRALPRTHRTPSRIEELVTAVTRGALRDSAVSLLSPTQDHINDLRPPRERYK